METECIERKKSCSACKKEFSCYTHNCWCAELPNIMSMTDSGGCLCPSCLKKAIEEKTSKASTC